MDVSDLLKIEPEILIAKAFKEAFNKILDDPIAGEIVSFVDDEDSELREGEEQC